MELCNESRMSNICHFEYPYVWTASSLGGNQISCTAANKTLDILSETSLEEHIKHMHCADAQIHKIGFEMYDNNSGNMNENISNDNLLPCYQYLHKIGAHFRHGLQECINDVCGIDDIFITGDGPLAQMLFTNKMTHNYREQKKLENETLRRKVMLGLFEKKIFLNPIGTKLYLSLMHTQKHLEYFYEALIDVLKQETKIRK